ncbi:hypothetical protein [Roseomonas sp. 18066]|uniref:hypothetical protein n=1 Tax=Roseomonas sp. 18066 TaxID=2681412 RepID=UPI00135A30F3|nr:hypothetical protein [Roseomonas sp. 18066]
MSAIKVTYLTLPDKAGGQLMNVGDRVIYRGVRNIMRAAIGPHEEETRYLSDHSPLPDDTDIAVICGTPQIANTSEVSRNIQRIADIAGSAVPVKLNLGAGAFYFDAFDADRAAADAAFAGRVQKAVSADYYRRYAGFDLLTCRDMGGSAVMNALGVAHKPLPCPGFFSALFEPRPLFRRPQQMVSVLNGTASFWNRVDADVHGFYRRLWQADPSRLFIAHDEQDVQMLDELGIPHVVFDDAEPFIRYLATADSLISLRVHGALPAWTLGLDVTLLGLDRRALLGEDFGAHFNVVPLRTEADFQSVLNAAPRAPLQDEAARRDFFGKYLPQYTAAIREVVERKLGRLPPLGVPLHGSGLPEVAEPKLGQPSGRYFRSLFHSREPSFEVGTDMLRTNQQHSRDGRLLEIRVGEKNTLSFGPYVRLPRGTWKVEAELTLAELPPAPVAEPNSVAPAPTRAKRLDLRVLKGIPSRELAKQMMPLAEAKQGDVLRFALDFVNTSDTGEIEAVFALVGGPLTGALIRIAPLRFTRQETADSPAALSLI